MSAFLFTDIDGCLNRHIKHPGSVYCGIDPACMALLNRIILATDCRLILTSAWRYYFHSKLMTLEGLEHLLFTHGLLPIDVSGKTGRICGVTAKDGPNVIGDDGLRERCRQIMERANFWLESDDQWAIVDDLDLAPFLGPYSKRFVRTDGNVGMTAADADRLIAILKGE